jgi:hypothetical protein
MRKALGVLIATLALTGCAGMRELSSEVSTYSLWPAGRQPSTYTFERLPSQQVHAQQMQLLEDAAHRAMESAGFKLATDPAAADVSVTLGARVTATDISPFDDPFWWRGGLWSHRYYGRPYFYRGFGAGFGWPYHHHTPVYEREVAMLIRDRKSGQPLYEARVVNDGYSPSINSLLGAMFEAGMKDFPQGGANPRRVVTQIAGE